MMKIHKLLLLLFIQISAGMLLGQIGQTTIIRSGAALPTECSPSFANLFHNTGASPGVYWSPPELTCSWTGPLGSSSGTAVQINGVAIGSVGNFNLTTPAAQANFINATWQVAGSSISAEVPYSAVASYGVIQLGTLCSGSQFVSSLTAAGQTCATPSSSGVTFQTNTVNNASQTVLNLTSSVATNGLTLTHTNTSGGIVQLGLSGILIVPGGGTGLGTLTAHQLYVGNGTGNPNPISAGAAGQVLESNGSTADPGFADPIISGPDAVGVAPTKNPVQTGCLFLTTPATLLTNQVGAIQCTAAQRLIVDGSQVTQPVSGTFWQATQPVSGTVTTDAGTGTFTVGQATGTNLHMVCDSGCSSSAGFTDNSAFTVGTTTISNIGGYYTSGADPTLTTGN